MLNESKLRPIEIISDQKLSDLEKTAILNGTVIMRNLIRDFTGKKISIRYFGSNDNSDRRFVFEIGKKYSPNPLQVSPDIMKNYLTALYNHDSPYIIGITKEDISKVENINDSVNINSNYSPEKDFICGFSSENGPAFISTYRPSRWNINEEKLLELLTLHEIGHMFGLPDLDGKRENIKNRHCSDKDCIMSYKGFTITNDWIERNYDRLHDDPLCPDCLFDLRDWFYE